MVCIADLEGGPFATHGEIGHVPRKFRCRIANKDHERGLFACVQSDRPREVCTADGIGPAAPRLAVDLTDNPDQ